MDRIRLSEFEAIWTALNAKIFAVNAVAQVAHYVGPVAVKVRVKVEVPGV